MNQWMQEHALVDVKVNYEWKIARVKRISNDFVEVALDDSENYKKKIDSTLVGKLRSVTNLEALKNFAGQFVVQRLEYVEKVVFQCDFESFRKNEEYFVQFFRGTLPVFLYSLVKSEITEILAFKDRIFKVLFKVLDVGILLLQSYSKVLERVKKGPRGSDAATRGLFETWPEIFDICEVVMGKEEFIRNFYEVCQYAPNYFQLETFNVSVFQAVFVDYFIRNSGLESMIQVIDSLPVVFTPEVFMIFGIDFSFYQEVLPQDIKSTFFARISTKFISISEKYDESLVKAEDYTKIFKNFVALIEENKEFSQQLEFSYIQVLLRVFFSNSLEKRIKGIAELSSFIERKSRVLGDQDLVKLIDDNNIILDILQKRAHFQILRRAGPVMKFLAQQGKLDENHVLMIQNLENSAEKKTSESFQIIFKAILPFMSVAYQKKFGVLMIFYKEEDGFKVFDKELFEECISSCKDCTQLSRTLKKISEIILLPENTQLKDSLIQFYSILINELSTSYSYLKLMIFILQSIPKTELDEIHVKLTLYSSTVQNLSNYLKYYQNFCKGSGVVLRVPHKDQVLVRFELLEFLMEKSKYNISRSSQKKLFSMCLFQSDNLVKEIYQKSIVSGNTFTSILSSEDYFVNWFSEKAFIENYSIFSFRVFKHVFLKINENSSLAIEKSQTKKSKPKFFCVLNKDIKAKDILFKLFYISKKSELGKIKVLIRNLLNCYSFEAIETFFDIFKENLDLLKSFHNPEESEDVFKFIGILHDILYGVPENNSGSKISVVVVFPAGKERFEVSETTNVIHIRKYLCSRLKNDLAEVSFRIENKLFTCHDNSETIKLSHDKEIVYVPQQTMLEIANNEVLLEVLKDYRDFCWKLAVSNQKYSRPAFEIARKLGCSETVLFKVAHFEISEEDFELGNLYISVQIIYRFYQYFYYEKDQEKAKTSDGLKQALIGMSRIVELPEIQNEFLQIIINVVHFSLYLKNFDLEAVLRIFICSFKWLIKNLNSSKFSEMFEVFVKIWSNISENIEEKLWQNIIISYMIENFKEIIEDCAACEKESREIGRFAEYLRYSLQISFLYENYLKELTENYSESIQNGESSYLQVIFKSIVASLRNNQEKLKFFITSHLRPVLPLLKESDHKENKNLKISLEILADHSEFLENFHFQEFLHEFLFALPLGPNSIQPRCKVNSTRVQAFRFVVEFCKTRPYDMQVLLRQINYFNNLKFFRKNEQKCWSIGLGCIKKAQSGLVGLRNPSAICYSNSLLQQLFHIPALRECILQILPCGSCPLVDSLKLSFTKLQFSFSTPVSGKNLVRVMNNSSNYSDQKDADEYLNNLFAGLLNSKSEDAALLVNLFFSFNQLFEVVPIDCKHKQIKEEIVTCLNVDLTTDSLLKSLRATFQGELLEHENAYACEKCKRKVTASRRQSFGTLPNYLIFVLKRFSFDAGSGCRVKINDRFVFDEKLEMNEFLNREIADLSQCSDYSLKGITLHTGNTDQGHYFSYIRTANARWFEFNDAEISEIKKELAFSKAFGGKNDENSPSAYILFYEKEKTDFKPFNLSGKIRNDLKNREMMKVGLKNEEKKFKDIIFSDNYLELMESLIGLPGTDIICCEFLFTSFIRMSLSDSYAFKIFKKFYDSASLAAVEHMIKMISSSFGCFELIFFNNKPETKRLIILLIKKHINSFTLDFLYIAASGMLSVVNSFHKVKTDAPDSFYEIMNLFLALLEDFCKQEKVTAFYLDTLCKRYPEFNSGVASFDLNILSKEHYSNIPQSHKPSNASLSNLFLYFSENLYRMTEGEKEALVSEQYMVYFVQNVSQKSELRNFSLMYAHLFENDANSAFNYLIQLLQWSFDKNAKHLKLMSLFINNYNKRTQILHLFLESYVELLNTELDSWSAYMIKYLVKFLRKVKKSLLTDLHAELLKKIRVLVDCFSAFHGKSYDSDKTQRMFEIFENDEDQEFQDSDDEIEQKYLQKDMIVYVSNPQGHNTLRSIILDSVESEILLVKSEETSSVKMIDKSKYDMVQISFRN